MKEQFGNILQFSFFSFLEHEFIKRGEAFSNKSSRFYYIEDKRINGYNRFSAPFKQFVHDSSISGAHICSQISGAFGIINDGQSGVMIDFDNGSVLVPTSLGIINKNSIISGSYSVKDFNFYTSNENIEDLLIENKYQENSRFQKIEGPIPPYDYVTPCVIITNRYSENKSFALGGLKNTETFYTAIIMHEDEDVIEAASSIMRDLKEKIFYSISLSGDPFNNFFGLKNRPFYYESLRDQYKAQNNINFIENVITSRTSDKLKLPKKIFFAIADFRISSIRTT